MADKGVPFMKCLSKLFLCLTLLVPFAARAELPAQVAQDFSALRGVVVMPLDQEFIVDLDDRSGLRVGDILTVVREGKNIFHPVTKEVIGTVEEPIGYLQVTRTSSGYSYAKPLTEGLKVKDAAPLRRFEQVPARFVDEKGDPGFVRQFQADLPQLKWLTSADATRPLLTFTLKQASLEVETADGNTLHSYAIKDSGTLAAPPSSAPRPFVGARVNDDPKLLDQVADGILSVFDLDDNEHFGGGNIGIIRQGAASQKGVWMGPNISATPVGVTVADLDGDGRQETALAFENKLVIARIAGETYTELADVELPGRVQLLSLDVADPDGNGRPELYVTAVDTHTLASFVVAKSDDEYTLVEKDIEWYLRTINLPGEGPVLVGQQQGRDIKSFFGKPFRIHSAGGSLARGEELDIPDKISIYSFVPFTDKEGRVVYAYLTDGSYLKVVTTAGVELWESSEYYGGSESCYDNRAENLGDMVLPTCLGPRLQQGPNGVVLVPQNDGQRIMQRYRVYKRSRMVAMKWDGFALTEKWRTSDQQGYLADFTLADANNDGRDELTMTVLFKHEGVVNQPRSTVVTYAID
jgi:hypothetical protein